MSLSLDITGLAAYLSEPDLEREIAARANLLAPVLAGSFAPPDHLGWFSPERWGTGPEVERLLEAAGRVRREAEVFVLVGVGGSNRGAQSVIAPLGDRRVEILYAGDNLSSQALAALLRRIEGKSVFVNAIAKDFNTLEPGIAFRVLRARLQAVYGPAARERIFVTGSRGPGQLYDLSQAHGWTFFPFPEDMGGRFSVISPVGLFPMAVAGVDILALARGAAECAARLKAIPLPDNPACRYAAARNLLGARGFAVECLAAFEPSLAFFARWWSQLFGESEGKAGRGVFPAALGYSEDLHALGQYLQEGRRMVMETFLDARFANPDFTIQPSPEADGFHYLDGQPFDALNQAVFEAAYTAHTGGGVPCFRLHTGPVSAALFGELFYFFMLSCCLSARWIGVDPFGQPGVEAYKQAMYRALGKFPQEQSR